MCVLQRAGESSRKIVWCDGKENSIVLPLMLSAVLKLSWILVRCSRGQDDLRVGLTPKAIGVDRCYRF